MEPKFYPDNEPVRDKIAMISQPMNGRTEEEILADRERAMNVLIANGYSVINTFFSDYQDNDLKDNGIKQIPVFYLAASIAAMSGCDAVYFVNGWERARGCQVEHDIALHYGLQILEG